MNVNPPPGLNARQKAAVLLAWLAVALLAGWSAVGDVARLPAWFSAYALATAVVATFTAGLGMLPRPDEPFWKRALRRALGWGLPVTMVVLGTRRLGGDLQDPQELVGFLLAWALGSVFFGVVSTAMQRTNSR